MRLFVAVWPSEEVRDALRSFERPPVPGLRWTTEDQWHVTLRFLGQVEDALVPSVVSALEAAPLPAAGEVVLGPATRRLGRGILVVPVAGLDDVAAAVRAALPADDPRPFVGHLTLARARRGSSVPGSLVGVPLAGAWRAGAVALVRSSTLPTGAVYEDVARFPLGGA